jgi:hypothetical protein
MLSLTSTLLFGIAAAQYSIPKAKPASIDPVITPGKPVGDSMPSVGFGTWQIPDNDIGVDAIARAIKLGYRHIDGATAYGNQATVGKGIAKALKENPEIKREDLWVTTKLWATRHKDVPGGNDLNLKQLGLDYFDLVLVHFPIGNSQVPVKNADGSAKVGANGRPVTETLAEYDYLQVSFKQKFGNGIPGPKLTKIRRCGSNSKSPSNPTPRASARCATSASPTST